MKNNILKILMCFFIAVSTWGLTSCKNNNDSDTNDTSEENKIPSYGDKSDQGLFKFSISCDVADVCEFNYVKKAYYSTGEEINLSINVDEGYYIKSYSDSDTVDSNRVITMNENKTIVVEIGEGSAYKLGDFKVSYEDGEIQGYNNYISLEKPSDSKFSYFELVDKRTNKKVQYENNKIYLSYLNNLFGEGFQGEWIDIKAYFTITEEIFVAYRNIANYNDGQYSSYLALNFSLNSTYNETPSNFISKLQSLESVSVKTDGDSIEVTGANYNSESNKYLKVVSNNNIQYKIFRIAVFTMGEKEYYYVKDSSILSSGNLFGNPKFNVLGTTVEFSY